MIPIRWGLEWQSSPQMLFGESCALPATVPREERPYAYALSSYRARRG